MFNTSFAVTHIRLLVDVVCLQSLQRMKIAVIGQSLFGADVYKLLQRDGHKIVGVFTVPDVNGKPDPLGNVLS